MRLKVARQQIILDNPAIPVDWSQRYVSKSCTCHCESVAFLLG